MTNLLVLGTGNAQKDLINYSLQKGLEVYACSNKISNFALDLADKFRKIDIKDEASIIDFIKEKNIKFVYSVGSDIAMPTIAKASNKLKLSCFITENIAETCHYKSRFRKIIPPKFNVEFLEVISMDRISKWGKFPCVIKPVDSQGQRGVFKVFDRDQLAGCFEKSISFSPSRKVIIEEYIEGDEISVNAYIVDGEIVFSIISDRITYDHYPGGIVKEHVFPSKYEKTISIKAEILSLVEKCSKIIGIKNGPIYFQIKIENGNNPKLIEVTPRLDGCHLWRIIHIVCGINLLDITMKHLFKMDDKCNEFKQEIQKYKQHSLKFISQKPGSVMDKYNFEDNSGNIKYVNYYYEPGEVVEELNGHMEKVGYYIIEEG